MAECRCDRHWTKITTAPAPHYTGGVTGKDKSNGIYAVRRINLMMLLKQLKSPVASDVETLRFDENFICGRVGENYLGEFERHSDDDDSDADEQQKNDKV
jgi:hypothetical protein